MEAYSYLTMRTKNVNSKNLPFVLFTCFNLY